MRRIAKIHETDELLSIAKLLLKKMNSNVTPSMLRCRYLIKLGDF